MQIHRCRIYTISVWFEVETLVLGDILQWHVDLFYNSTIHSNIWSDLWYLMWQIIVILLY